MTTESQILEAPVPEVVEGPERWYVFCPEEPTLMIIVNDELMKFSNGRLIIDMALAGAGQRLEFFRQQIPRFVVSSSLDAPELHGILHTRIVETFAKMAGASNPTKVMQEVDIAIRIMLNLPKGKRASQMTQNDAIRALAHAMPTTIKDHLLPATEFAEVTARTADEAVMREATAGVDLDAPPDPPPTETERVNDEPAYDPSDEDGPEPLF